MKKQELRTGRNLGWILLILMILWVITFKKVVAQAPLGVNYQGIARNMDGTPKSEKAISIRVSILEGGISGIVEYSEIHEVLTNQFGLFTLVIGQGDHVGSIQDVDWASGNKWLQIELDADGGSNFDVIGAQQIFSVPYAMYATESGSGLEAGDGISIEDGVVTNTAKDRPVTVLGAGSVTVSGSYPDFIVSGTDNVNDADSDPANEIQTLSKSGSLVTLSNSGGTISIADGDSDPSNEIQTLNQTGSSVSLSNGGGTITIDDPDADPANELQTLTRIGEDITLSNGGGTVSVADGDADPGNEMITGGSFIANNTIRIVDGAGNTDIPVGILNSNLNADGNRIINLADPIDPQDAVTKNYLDVKDATDYAFKSIISGTGSGSALLFNLSTTDFDEGGLISIDQITISEPGIYLFNVKGSSSSNAPIVINVIDITGTTSYPIGLINIGKYSDTILLKLKLGDILQLKAISTTVGEVFTLEFFGFKI